MIGRLLLLASLAAPVLAAQGTTPVFEVAVVRPSPPNAQVAFRTPIAGGQLTATGRSVTDLVKFAYGLLLDAEVVDGPAWVRTERFDVVASVEKGKTYDQVRLMMRALLAERFKLATHADTREMSVLSLVRSERSGTFGAKMQRASSECRRVLGLNGEEMPLPPLAKNGSPPNPAPSAPSRCGAMYAPGHISTREVTMGQFARGLSQVLGRPVVDDTGLSGYFDLDVEFSRDLALNADPAASNRSDDDLSRPTIYTALQEQVGLRLASRRAAISVLVIDAIERPAPE
jgi:uncharacterized protein (TIGR03435 family)